MRWLPATCRPCTGLATLAGSSRKTKTPVGSAVLVDSPPTRAMASIALMVSDPSGTSVCPRSAPSAVKLRVSSSTRITSPGRSATSLRELV